MGFNMKILLVIFILFGGFCFINTEGYRKPTHKHHNKNYRKDGGNDDGVNYYRTQELPDGERITWAAYNGILAKERRTTHENVRWTVIARTVTNGRILVLSIIDGTGATADCDVQSDRESINLFSSAFIEGVPSPIDNEDDDTSKTVTIRHKKDIPDYIKDLLEFKDQMHGCKRLHRSFKPVAVSKSAGIGEKTHDGSRNKRSTEKSLMYPGTNWCGRGSVAKGYDDLGSNIETDKCCRDHDHCPYTITSFQTKYGLFNYRFVTLSHCECDYSFRTCLRNTNTEVAGMVGNIFFNYYRIQCFTFEPENVCTKRSWWGKCQKYKYEYKAILPQVPMEYGA